MLVSFEESYDFEKCFFILTDQLAYRILSDLFLQNSIVFLQLLAFKCDVDHLAL